MSRFSAANTARNLNFLSQIMTNNLVAPIKKIYILRPLTLSVPLLLPAPIPKALATDDETYDTNLELYSGASLYKKSTHTFDVLLYFLAAAHMRVVRRRAKQTNCECGIVVLRWLIEHRRGWAFRRHVFILPLYSAWTVYRAK